MLNNDNNFFFPRKYNFQQIYIDNELFIFKQIYNYDIYNSSKSFCKIFAVNMFLHFM